MEESRSILIAYPTTRFERHDFDGCDSAEEIIEALKPIQARVRILPNCPIEADDWNDWDDNVKDAVFGGNEDDYSQAKAMLTAYFGDERRMERIVMRNWAVDVTGMSLEEIRKRLPEAKGEDWGDISPEAVSGARDTDRDNAYVELRSLVEEACGMQPIKPTNMTIDYEGSSVLVTVCAVLLKWEQEDADGSITCNLVAVTDLFHTWDIHDLFTTKQIRELSEKVRKAGR